MDDDLNANNVNSAHFNRYYLTPMMEKWLVERTDPDHPRGGFACGLRALVKGAPKKFEDRFDSGELLTRCGLTVERLVGEIASAIPLAAPR